MLDIPHHLDRVARVALILVLAGLVALGGLMIGTAGGGASEGEGARVEPHPDWFAPIWDAYGHNPAITPDFDFASLYAPPPEARRVRGRRQR